MPLLFMKTTLDIMAYVGMYVKISLTVHVNLLMFSILCTLFTCLVQRIKSEIALMHLQQRLFHFHQMCDKRYQEG